MGKIKITFVLHTNLQNGRGAERSVINYATLLDKDQYDITIIQNNKINVKRLHDETVEELQERVKVLTLKSYYYIYSFLQKSPIVAFLSGLIIDHIVRFTITGTEGKEALKEIENSDIVYFFSNQQSVYFKKGKAIFVGSNHTNFIITIPKVAKLEYKLMKANLIYRKMDAFHFFPSIGYALGSYMEKPTLYLWSGVDINRFKPGKRDGPTKFLFVGDISKSKGVLTLFESWDKMQVKSDVELHVVGGGELSDYVKKKVNSKIFYHGIVNEDTLGFLYSTSDVFVYPTEFDTFSLVVAQAISSGLFVITSPTLKGNFDLYEEKGFLIYTDNNPDLISKEMNKAHEKINIMRDLVENEHKLARENLDLEQGVRRLYDFFEQLHERSAKSR